MKFVKRPKGGSSKNSI